MFVLKRMFSLVAVLTLTFMLSNLSVSAESIYEDNHSVTEMANNNVNDNTANMDDDDDDMEWGWLGLLGLLGLAGLKRRDDRKD